VTTQGEDCACSLHIPHAHRNGGGINSAAVVVEMIQFPLQIGSHRKRIFFNSHPTSNLQPAGIGWLVIV
jgi:hypothetical protein